MIFLIKIILIITIVTTTKGKCYAEPAPANEVSSNILEPIRSFAANMRYFFNSVASDIDNKRIKFKNILRNLVKDIQSDESLMNSAKLSTTMRSELLPGADKFNVKRYLANCMEVSAHEEVSLEETKMESSEPTLDDFLQYIEKHSAYNNGNITSKDITNTKQPILTISNPYDNSKVTANQVVKPDIIAPLSTGKIVPKKQNKCTFMSVISSIITYLQDNHNETIDSEIANPPFKRFESTTIPYNMIDLTNNKSHNKQEKTKYIQQIFHDCFENILEDVANFIEVKMNNKTDTEHNLKQKVKNDKRHFLDQKTELIKDVIHYFNQKYLDNENSTPQYEEEIVQVSPRYSMPTTEFHPKFKPTPKVFQYFIKKISKSNSYTKIDQSSQTDSSAIPMIFSTIKTTSRSVDLFTGYNGPAIESNVTNLQAERIGAVSKLLINKKTLKSTTILPKLQLKSTVPTQIEQSTVASALKVFLKFINLYSKENKTSTETSITSTTRPLKPVSLLMKRPLVFSHGYRVALHHIETVDGYMLTVHRILPRHKFRPIIKRRNRIALLHHGLLGSADDWVLLGPNKALPYLLTDIGYDVWLTNARGNKYSYSPSNKRLNVSDYWNFSFHEIGLYDLSAVIDHIRLKTKGSTRIDFIGHSMGATALLVLLSTYPQYNFLLRSAILLAPLAYMYRSQGLLRLLSEYQTKKGYKSLYFLGETEFMPSRAFPNKVTKLYCKGDKISCLNPWLLIANGGLNMKNKTLEKIILEHVPAGGSTKTIVHYTQLVRSGQFQRFDLGGSANAMRYGTRAPPPYRLNDVTIPVVIFSSRDDLLSTTIDTENLIANLPNFIGHHVVERDKFTHTDFVWAEDAPDEIYYRIINLLDDESRRDSLGTLVY